jgi:signal transduction histidine kinase
VNEDYAELLSLAVHEFRTPASVVGGYLRMLLRDNDAPLTDRQRRMVEEAEKSCGRIVELVGELSEIAKLDRGAIVMGDDPFDLFSMLEELASSVHEARDRDVHLQVRGEPAGAPLRGDLPRMRAAFAAFCRAVLREQASPSIVVADRRRVKKDGTLAALVVVAPERELQRALDGAPAPFVDWRGGLGLALPIARRVIERHGGTVWSPRQTDGGSSEAIVVSLPVNVPDETSRRATAAGHHSKGVERG